MLRFAIISLSLVACCSMPSSGAEGESSTNFRRPSNDQELRGWLENMVWYHHFSDNEIRSATGLSQAEIKEAKQRFDIAGRTRPEREKNANLLVLPYPGGRHPRIGFLEGAIDPQRETKVSVFTPWDPRSYVVVDVPEAIWSDLGLTYLAHTHVPTIWSKSSIELEPLEWTAGVNESLTCQRRLPNGITFGTSIHPGPDAVRMKMWLTNGTERRLSKLRVQNCVMLKGASGFQQQTNDNKLFRDHFVACHGPNRRRWIITAWTPSDRPWANERCPCLHSDPRFPDCDPGQTQHLRGWLSFYEGEDIEKEIDRIRKTWESVD